MDHTEYQYHIAGNTGTTNFVFPSDADRLNNDELDRVCCYVEELLEQNRELTGTLVKLQRKVQRVKKFINANYNHGVRIEGKSVDNYFSEGSKEDILFEQQFGRAFRPKVNMQEMLDCKVDIQKQIVRDAVRREQIKEVSFARMDNFFITGAQTAQPDDVSFEQIREKLAAAMEKMNTAHIDAVMRQGFYTPPKQFEPLFDNFTFPIRIPKRFDYARVEVSNTCVSYSVLARRKQLQEAFKLATLDPNLFAVERDENGMVI